MGFKILRRAISPKATEPPRSALDPQDGPCVVVLMCLLRCVHDGGTPKYLALNRGELS